MSNVPDRPRARYWDEAIPVGKAQVPAQLTVGERAADRVLFGPRGEVLVRIQDRPTIGFRR